MKRISEYTEITTVSEADVVPIVDVSDTDQASTGSTKKGTIEKIADYLKDRAETLTNKILTTARLNTPKVNEDVTVTATSTELNKLDGLTADTAELNQLDGVDVGGNTSGDIVTIDDTQTLANKTLTSPTINYPSISYPYVSFLKIGNSLPTAAISDDSALSFNMPSSEGMVLIRQLGDSNNGCLITYRQNPAACNILFNGVGSTWEARIGVLSGTTGTDTKYTISAHTDGKIYVENRRGSLQYIFATVIGQ